MNADFEPQRNEDTKGEETSNIQHSISNIQFNMRCAISKNHRQGKALPGWTGLSKLVGTMLKPTASQPTDRRLRDREKINSPFMALGFWPLARRERRAYPANGSVRSKQRSQRAKDQARKGEVIFSRSLTRIFRTNLELASNRRVRAPGLQIKEGCLVGSVPSRGGQGYEIRGRTPSLWLLVWGWLNLAFALGMLAAGASDVQTSESASVEPVVWFDLTYLFQLDLSDESLRRRFWDESQLVAALEGLVNRTEPRLFIRYLKAPDDFWWGQMTQPGGWLAERKVVRVGTLDELLKRFQSFYQGAVAWDERVPATANLASTIAGCDDLLRCGSMCKRILFISA